MQNADKRILVIGGGITGLSAALQLADMNFAVTLIEQSASLGGYAARFSCKATDRCVRCGACLVEQKVRRSIDHQNIEVILEYKITNINKNYIYSIDLQPTAPGCRTPRQRHLDADAIIVATGFQHYDPESKPYGYRRFDDVVTNLDLEQMLRTQGTVRRPSNGAFPDRIAFFQCVGSRDAKLKHLWCSKVCCGSALRTANRIKWQRPDTQITVFYIDIQTFGKDFEIFYHNIRDSIRMVRTLPADIFLCENNRLQVNYFDDASIEEEFDLVVLSIGMMPQGLNADLFNQLGFSVSPESDSFQYENVSLPFIDGVFAAGAVLAPMGIADSIASAQKAARDVVSYLSKLQTPSMGSESQSKRKS